MMRKLRRTVDAGLPLVATMTVLFATVDPLGFSSRTRVIVVVAGLLLLQASVWRMANPLLPSERKFLALREEGDRFVGLIRRLNHAAVAADVAGRPVAGDPEVEGVRSEMHATVDRMVELAARRGE